jgi:glycosyltransferase involved in cell wall biosynthesis
MPTPSRIVAPAQYCLPGTPKNPWRVALIGNYPPRRCGIATFTADVRDALIAADPNLICDVYAMTDTDGGYAYPREVVQDLRSDRPEDYLDAAEHINRNQADVICVQHEFGIFGGPAGEHLMLLLEATGRPVVTTLHTVLESPDPDQRRVFERLIARSDKVIVMAERGRDMLRRVWRTPEEKIVLIPHGAPDRPLSDTAPFKTLLGVTGRDVLFTFGLISPNKGIEYAIRAMPAIVARRPNALYIVLGASHPHLIAQEGERYREGLAELADNLGVAEHVRLIDEYADTPRLIEYLQAADIYVTPYLNRDQVTSGTLSYAAALGKPIISTPYWHAEELLKDGRGRLIPFASAEAISAEAIALLDDGAQRLGLARRIHDAARETVWSCFGMRLVEVFERAGATLRPPRRMAPPTKASIKSSSLEAVVRLPDSRGVSQPGIFSLPDLACGLGVDNHAGAPLLMHPRPRAANNGRQV